MSEENTHTEAKPEEVTTTGTTTTTTTSPPSPASRDEVASDYRRENEYDDGGDGDEDTAQSDMIKEWVKFGVLVAVLFGAVFIVWASRPLIFGQIVPAVMNANPPAVVVQTEPNEPVGEAPESGAEADAGTEVDTGTNTQQIPLVIQEESSVTVEDATAGETSETTADEAADGGRTIPYMVQQGDSLYAISQRYGVSIADIVAVNGGVITNPNNIQPGTEIQIPVP